jgi:NAD(P)-dependent dehydrogenase (short-subunit alcohol dehydrogenase family)
VALDVTVEEQAFAAAKAAIDRFGRIDILLNNAGFGLMGAVEEASATEIEAVYSDTIAAIEAKRKAQFAHPVGVAQRLAIGGLLIRARTPIRVVEHEDAPGVWTAGERSLHCRAAGVLGYNIRPEPKTSLVSL